MHQLVVSRTTQTDQTSETTATDQLYDDDANVKEINDSDINYVQ